MIRVDIKKLGGITAIKTLAILRSFVLDVEAGNVVAGYLLFKHFLNYSYKACEGES